MNFVAGGSEVAANKVFFVFGKRIPPALCRVVIVRARIDDGVLLKIVRQIQVVSVSVKGKLQNTHTRQANGLAQCGDLRGDDAKVFGDDFQRCFAILA